MSEARLLWCETTGIFRILRKNIRKGKIELAKNAKFNCGQLKNATLALPGRIKGVKYLPLYFGRWDSCMPFDVATSKPYRKLKLVKVTTTKTFEKPKGKHLLKFWLTNKKRITSKVVHTEKLVETQGVLEWHEMKLEEPPAGAKMLTPENYNNIYKNVALEQLMSLRKKDDIPWLWLLIGCLLGAFVAFAIFNIAFPEGVHAATQAAADAINSAAGAAPSGG